MITYTPFKAEHVFKLNMQDAQKWSEVYLRVENMRGLEDDWSNTLWLDGKPILCAGAAERWPGCAMVWAFVSEDVTPKNFLEVHNLAKQYLSLVPFKRLEAYVDCNFKAGHRWVRALGFSLEAERMRSFQIDGKDCALYARVKE